MAAAEEEVSPAAFLAMGRGVLASQPFSVLSGANWRTGNASASACAG